MYEADDYGNTMSSAALPWYAVRVRSNFERKTGESLAHRGYEVFVPEYTVKRYGRATGSPRPLLPGYVLCRINLNQRLPVLTAPGVVGIVGCGRVPLPVDEAQVQHVKIMATSGIGAAPYPFLRCGDVVVVNSGPLAGLRGFLIEIKNSFRVVVSIDLLQRSVATELEWDAVTPVKTAELAYASRTNALSQIAL